MTDPTDILADLQPRARKYERIERVRTHAESILAARKRGCSWKDIAARLTERGIKTSADTVRVQIQRYEASLDTSPKKKVTTQKQRTSHEEVDGNTIKARKNKETHIATNLATPIPTMVDTIEQAEHPTSTRFLTVKENL